jgi:hypothetical protein
MTCERANYTIWKTETTLTHHGSRDEHGRRLSLALRNVRHLLLLLLLLSLLLEHGLLVVNSATRGSGGWA